MATTTVMPAVKTKLLALFAADSGMTGVALNYSWDLPTREQVSFYAAENRTEYNVVRADRQIRDETVQLLVYIEACEPGQASPAAEARAVEILAVIEEIVAANATLATAGVGLVTSISVVGWQSGIDPNGEGFDGLIRLTLEYQARLT